MLQSRRGIADWGNPRGTRCRPGEVSEDVQGTCAPGQGEDRPAPAHGGSLPLAQSTVSQHLKVLKDAGLVLGTIDGPRTCYGLDREALAEFKALAGALL